MADWYAQNSSVNINSVNEWNADPAGAGAWLTWPAASGDNLYANGKTAIACNVDFNIGTGKISTEAGAGTAGGGFTCSTARTITANITAGTTACLSTAGAVTIAWTGNVTGGTSNNAFGVSQGGLVVFNLTGSVNGGSGASAHGIYNSSSGSGSVSETVTGGSSTSTLGISCTSSGTFSVVNATGGSGAGSDGVRATGSGAITITGIITNTATAAGASGRITYSPSDATKYITYGATNYYSDLPIAGNVTEDDTVAGVTGVYHEATEAEVQSGVAFGANSALTGTYAGGGGGQIMIDGAWKAISSIFIMIAGAWKQITS